MRSLEPEEYRVKFIRGRARRLLDSMLPTFASVVMNVCPCPSEQVVKQISQSLERFFPGAESKTLHNYTTEILGQLFGMIVHENEGFSRPSALTEKFVNDSDQPAFFKVLISRIQYPNPMNRSWENYEKNLEDGCHIRPLVLVLEVLRDLGGPATYLELRTFVLSNRRAYTGSLNSTELALQIKAHRETHQSLPDPSQPNRPYHHQHIKEMLGLLSLANLVTAESEDKFTLNYGEQSTLDWIFRTPSNQGLFRACEVSEDFKSYQRAWSSWYGRLPEDVEASELETPLTALGIDLDDLSPKFGRMTSARHSTQEIGRIGEELVLRWQIKTVSDERPQDLKHVKDRSAERGIGYDIQSVWCSTQRAGQFRYFEVKTTKRATRPPHDSRQLDSVTLTANEYRAAQSHGMNFAICRVYLYSGGFDIFVIADPIARQEKGEVIIEPMDWNLFIPAHALGSPAVEG